MCYPQINADENQVGWMLMKQNPKRIGRTDISDLNEDPVVVWQHKNYLKVVLFMGLIFPTLVCGIGWGDWLGGYIYGGILRYDRRLLRKRRIDSPPGSSLSSKLRSVSIHLLIVSTQFVFP